MDKNMPTNDTSDDVIQEGAIESKAFFEELDAVYRQPGHLMYQKLQLVKSLIRPGSRLLDIGCGTGEALDQLQDNVEFVVGVDASAMAVKYASGKVKNRDYINVIRSSGLNLCFKSGVFDSCLFLDVLEHLEHPQDALLQAARVLKEGAQLIVTVPNWTDWIVSGVLRMNPEHRTFHTPKGWQHLIQQCGFQPHSYRAVRLPYLEKDEWAEKFPYLGMCIVLLAERRSAE